MLQKSRKDADDSDDSDQDDDDDDEYLPTPERKEKVVSVLIQCSFSPVVVPLKKIISSLPRQTFTVQ